MGMSGVGHVRGDSVCQRLYPRRSRWAIPAHAGGTNLAALVLAIYLAQTPFLQSVPVTDAAANEEGASQEYEVFALSVWKNPIRQQTGFRQRLRPGAITWLMSRPQQYRASQSSDG